MNSKKHKLPRRILAMLLAICMFVTMFPSAMFAVEGDGSVQENSQTVIEKSETDNNGVTFKKTATRTSATTWDVQIDITPNEDIKSAPLDVVLVLDTSPSMAWDLSGEEDSEPGWGEDSRLQTMKDAAYDLIDELAKVGNVNVGLVQFDGEAHSEIENGLISLDSNKSIDTIKREIYKLTTEGHNGTNISDGLDTAGDVLEENGTTGSQKVVILLSDGEPNYPKKPHGPGWGSSEEYATYMAKQSADTLRDVADIYTVGFLAADTADLLTYIAGDASRYYQAEKAADLVEAFTNIAYEITAMVNDDVGNDVKISGTPLVELNGQTYKNGKLTVSDDNSHLLWNPDEEEGISKGQTLTIKYTVTLKDSAETLYKKDQQDDKDQVVSVLVNKDAGLRYQITGQTDIYSIDLDPLQDNIELAKLTEYRVIDTSTNKTQVGSPQYVFIYSDTDTEQQSFSWQTPQATWNNTNYSNSTIVL